MNPNSASVTEAQSFDFPLDAKFVAFTAMARALLRPEGRRYEGKGGGARLAGLAIGFAIDSPGDRMDMANLLPLRCDVNFDASTLPGL